MLSKHTLAQDNSEDLMVNLALHYLFTDAVSTPHLFVPVPPFREAILHEARYKLEHGEAHGPDFVYYNRNETYARVFDPSIPPLPNSFRVALSSFRPTPLQRE